MKQIFLFLLTIWLLLSFLTIPYNALKTISEFKTWYPLTDKQKREMIFGDVFNFVYFISSKTPKNSHIFIYSKDDKIGLVSSYFLYPRRISVTKDSKNIKYIINSSNFDYVSLYDKEISFKGYKKIANYFSKTSSDFGVIYKKND